MSTTEHTPTPWHAEGNNIISANGRAVTLTSVHTDTEKWRESRDETLANAAYIVRTCNSHKQLLAACKRHKQMFIEQYGNTGWMANYDDMEAAITAAEVKE